MWVDNYRRRLYHYGVKGQKWGVRNGPPYPINRASPLRIVSLKIATKIGILVTGVSIHAEEQAKTRGVKNEDIVDALKNPLYIGDGSTDADGRKSKRFIGYHATVNVNPETGLIATVWPTGRKKRKKYMKKEVTNDVY